MTDHPIIFSRPMVLALLAGKKTQTRRLLYNGNGGQTVWAKVVYALRLAKNVHSPRIDRIKGVRVGDRLWVRENFRVESLTKRVIHQADANPVYMGGWKWTPSIHMPRAASRITLAVTALRIENIQEISHGDAVAEGVGIFAISMSAQKRYRELWESLNGADSWSANPEVVVVTFTVHVGNIDKIQVAA